MHFDFSKHYPSDFFAWIIIKLIYISTICCGGAFMTMHGEVEIRDGSVPSTSGPILPEKRREREYFL